MEKILYRKRKGFMVGGVCAGLGDYLALDPLWIRLLFVIWTVAGGGAVFIYFILWAVMPAEGDDAPMNLGLRIREIGNEISQIARQPNPQLIIFAGVGLIGMGIVYLLRQYEIPWPSWVNWGLIWPLILMFFGIFILARAVSRRG